MLELNTLSLFIRIKTGEKEVFKFTWKPIRVEASGLKLRTLKVREQHVTLPGYKDMETGQVKTIRQIVITRHGKI